MFHGVWPCSGNAESNRLSNDAPRTVHSARVCQSMIAPNCQLTHSHTHTVTRHSHTYTHTHAHAHTHTHTHTHQQQQTHAYKHAYIASTEVTSNHGTYIHTQAVTHTRQHKCRCQPTGTRGVTQQCQLDFKAFLACVRHNAVFGCVSYRIDSQATAASSQHRN